MTRLDTETGIDTNDTYDLLRSPTYRLLKPPAAGQASWTKGFWHDRQQLTDDAILPTIERAMERMGVRVGARLRNFRILAGLEPAEPALESQPWGTDWSDGDVYKWLEALIWAESLRPQKERRDRIEQAIGWIAAAQEPDGYLHTVIQLDGNRSRWQIAKDHELYNFGHLFTAAAVCHRLLGDDSLLAVAVKAADHLVYQFNQLPAERIGRLQNNPSHLMGLVALYEETGNEAYLDLTEFFIDIDLMEDSTGELSTDLPFVEEDEGLGHAVFAAYRLCGVADLYSHRGDTQYLKALDRIWNRIATSQLYITGATGPYPKGISSRDTVVTEAFGRPYDLPHRTAYNETCANIGFAMFSWRMLMLTGDAKYADAVEQVIFNSGLSGLQLDGRAFHYVNPLARDRRHNPPHPHAKAYYTPTRWKEMYCYCCPPQLARFINWSHQWAWSTSQDAVWVHQFGTGVFDTSISGSALKLSQETDYPWDGLVRLHVVDTPETPWTLHLRIPGWCSEAMVRVNGEEIPDKFESGSYLAISRSWQADDEVRLELSMPACLVEAHPDIEQTRGQFAIRRGPMVYCLESTDLPESIAIDRVRLSEKSDFWLTDGRDEMSGVKVLIGILDAVPEIDWSNRLYRSLESVEQCERQRDRFKGQLIPYFAWNNRGDVDMRIWIPSV